MANKSLGFVMVSPLKVGMRTIGGGSGRRQLPVYRCPVSLWIAVFASFVLLSLSMKLGPQCTAHCLTVCNGEIARVGIPHQVSRPASWITRTMPYRMHGRSRGRRQGLRSHRQGAPVRNSLVRPVPQVAYASTPGDLPKGVCRGSY